MKRPFMQSWRFEPNYVWSGCVKSIFFGALRQIIFFETHHFHDFASQNQEKDVSIQI